MGREDRRERILQGAEDLFLSRRYDRVTLDEVCRKAGVGKGTIYRYFKGKEDLFAQTILHGLDELRGAIEAKASGPGGTDEKLYAAARVLRRFHRRRHALFQSGQAGDFRRMFHGRGLHTQCHKRRDALVEIVAGVLRSGADAGAYRKDLPAEVGAHMFLGMVRSTMWAEGGEGARPVSMKRLVDVFLEGFRFSGAVSSREMR